MAIFEKSGQVHSGQISSWIWQLPVQQHQYDRLITDKTVLPCGVFAIIISVTQMKKYKIHWRFTNLVKNW